MNKNETFYAVTTQQGSSVKLDVRNTTKGSIIKTYRFPGKIEGHPVISGDTVTITVTIGILKKAFIQNIRTGRKIERSL